ncbi:MAG: hypothetical protein SFU98_02460 [Leptospiraceae bacterium]|nr:hypothetical protein [Leptospiraceae bacterium]
MKRRNAIELIQYYHRMHRNHLLSKDGDKINALQVVSRVLF